MPRKISSDNLHPMYGIPLQQEKDGHNYELIADSNEGLTSLEASKLRRKLNEKCILDEIICRFFTKTFSGKKYVYLNMGINKEGGLEEEDDKFYDVPENIQWLRERKENYLERKKQQEDYRKSALQKLKLTPIERAGMNLRKLEQL